MDSVFCDENTYFETYFADYMLSEFVKTMASSTLTNYFSELSLYVVGAHN